PAGTGRDRDLDGVPDAFDIDVNGNMVLNALDRSGRAGVRTAAAGDPAAPGPVPPGPAGPGPGPATVVGNFSQLFLTVEETVNADAAAVTTADIDRAVKEHLSVVFVNVPQDTRLDCGALVYCSAGGTGIVEAVVPGPDGGGDPFPACCSPDADGMGLMRLNSRGEFRLRPHASTAQIGTGDAFLLRGDGESATETPQSLNFVFTTTPAVRDWSDGAGGGGTITYPAAADAQGTVRSPIPVGRDAAGEYVVTFTLWRPQRQAIAGAGEAGGFVDVGGLEYEANVPNVPRSPSAQPGSGSPPQCPMESLSTADPSLTIRSTGPGGRLVDSSADRPADPANTLTFTVNLSSCASLRGGSLATGDILNLDIAANAPDPSHDHANQIVYVRMQ
ncbi:MAG: hypothetical protein AB1416_12250, partial [Actinomycetota bacterium]